MQIPSGRTKTSLIINFSLPLPPRHSPACLPAAFPHPPPLRPYSPAQPEVAFLNIRKKVAFSFKSWVSEKANFSPAFLNNGFEGIYILLGMCHKFQ
jgi:hypothetical protein